MNKELKALVLMTTGLVNKEEWKGCYDTIEKGLKVLEIIKEKNVFVWGFIHRQEEIDDFKLTYEYYKTHYGYFHSGYDCDKYLLTQEEYELLKEVLL